MPSRLLPWFQEACAFSLDESLFHFYIDISLFLWSRCFLLTMSLWYYLVKFAIRLDFFAISFSCLSVIIWDRCRFLVSPMKRRGRSLSLWARNDASRCARFFDYSIYMRIGISREDKHILYRHHRRWVYVSMEIWWIYFRCRLYTGTRCFFLPSGVACQQLMRRLLSLGLIFSYTCLGRLPRDWMPALRVLFFGHTKELHKCPAALWMDYIQLSSFGASLNCWELCGCFRLDGAHVSSAHDTSHAWLHRADESHSSLA